MHVLSDVDEEAHTAVCAKCGPVRVQRRPRANGAVGWACREARKERRARNLDGWRGARKPVPHDPAKRRRKVHGLAPEDYDAMVEAQAGRCAICQRDAPLCVDHDHATGRIRGLLCSPCNVGLGHFRDTPALLHQAAAYLVQQRSG